MVSIKKPSILKNKNRELIQTYYLEILFILSIISYLTRARGIIVNYIKGMTIRRIKGVEYCMFTLHHSVAIAV